MILGAGAFQVAGIRKAADLGYHVVTADFQPNNIGHRFSHETLNISTTDVAAVTAAARSLGIDGIFSMASEVALPTVARVTEELGLPGPNRRLVATMTEKDRFRSFQAAQGLDVPAFIQAGNFDETVAAWPGGPAIVKPALSSGSRGVARIDKVDAGTRALFEAAREYSLTGKVCLEEYIDGQDIAVEGFIRNGTVQHAFVTHKHIQRFAVTGHELPATLNHGSREEIIRQLDIVMKAIGYETGPFDADFRMCKERLVLLEITPRLGGNGIPVLVEAAHGVSLIELSIRHAMGDLAEVPTTREKRDALRHASILLYSSRSGIVKSVATEETLRLRMPAVADLSINLTRGQAVERFAHGGHVFGYCVVRMADGTEFDAMASRILGALNLTT